EFGHEVSYSRNTYDQATSAGGTARRTTRYRVAPRPSATDSVSVLPPWRGVVSRGRAPYCARVTDATSDDKKMTTHSRSRSVNRITERNRASQRGVKRVTASEGYSRRFPWGA